MAASDRYPPARGDEAELFRDFNDELMRLIGHAVHHCTPQIIEDACSFAWAEFLRHQPDRGHNWRGWIFRTAQRQAWVLAREARDALPLISSDGSDQRGVRGAETIDELELRRDVTDALSVLAQIPPRMQRIALLRALGMRHREIAEITGDSPTSVHRLIVTANERIADVLEARAHAERPSAPRAERLWELERHPPGVAGAQDRPTSDRQAAGQGSERAAAGVAQGRAGARRLSARGRAGAVWVDDESATRGARAARSACLGGQGARGVRDHALW